MPGKKLIVVHGMGEHTLASVKAEVLDAFTKAFGLYESLQGKSVEDQFEILPIIYNQFFNGYRQQLAERSGKLAERITALDGSLPISVQLAGEVNAIEAKLGQDAFFTTHWLDVILYRFTLLSEPIRLAVAEPIADAVAAADGANVHVLGHSLGTSVLHDTLAKSYGPENLKTDGGKSLNLSPDEHRLGGVHMVANVSRALQTFVKAGSSIVRPGALGCAHVFGQYRHRLDPIPKIKAFDPTDNGGWVTHDVWDAAYRLVEPSSVTSANVHGLGHYLLIPDIHLPLFRLLFGFRPKKGEREAAQKSYNELTVEGKAKALQAAFGDFEPGNKESTQAVLEAAKALKDMVQGFGETF